MKTALKQRLEGEKGINGKRFPINLHYITFYNLYSNLIVNI